LEGEVTQKDFFRKGEVVVEAMPQEDSSIHLEEVERVVAKKDSSRKEVEEVVAVVAQEDSSRKGIYSFANDTIHM
jgi:hypothetical protein